MHPAELTGLQRGVRTIGADIDPHTSGGGGGGGGGGVNNNTNNRTCFAIRISDVRKKTDSAMISIGVTSAARDQLSVIGPAQYGTRDTEFVLSSTLRSHYKWYFKREKVPGAIGMCGTTNGSLVTPLLSTAPKPTAEDETRDPTGSGFVRTAPAITVVGVVCDLARNSLMFYVNDQIVQTTRIALDSDAFSGSGSGNGNGGGAKSTAAAAVPFEWTLRASQQLRDCRVYLAIWSVYLKAEFIDWSPPPPPPPPPPSSLSSPPANT